jgi:hypothetical protein
MRRLLVKANVISCSILVTLIMEALSSSETSIVTRDALPNIPEDGILQNVLVQTLCFQKLTLRKLTVISKEYDNLQNRTVSQERGEMSFSALR